MSGTERPWHVDGVFVVNDGDLIVTTMGHDARAGADAELIVRAVNAFDDLVGALEQGADLIRHGAPNEHFVEWEAVARAVLARVRCA